MEEVLLIGGHGFIGSNLALRLLDAGYRVRIFCRQQADLGNLKGAQVELFYGDLLDADGFPEALRPALAGCKWVFNLATSGSPLAKYAEQRLRINVDAAAEIARLVKEENQARLIHVSSSTAVGYPFSGEIADEDFSFNAEFDHYALTKQQGEQVVLEQVAKGLDAVIAIPCSTIGAHGMKANQKAMVRNVMKGQAKVCPPGGVCLTDVRDLVDGLLLCARKGESGRRYILGGHNILYREYLGEIAKAAGSRSPRFVLPKSLLPLLGRALELLGAVTGREVSVDRNVARMIASNLYYSSQRAEQELGYKITDWRKTLQQVVADLSAEG
jgi:dihydroflavonol-4-reductase